MPRSNAQALFGAADDANGLGSRNAGFSRLSLADEPKIDARGFSIPAFAINGRFLTQSVTGVQRYGREITNTLDDGLGRLGGSGVILAPSGPHDFPRYRNLRVIQSRMASGYLWEQFFLAKRADVPLLNLCNAAPMAKKPQVVCIHDANVFNFPESYSLPFRVAYKAMLPLIGKRSAFVTTVSNASADELTRHLSISRKNIVVLPNGHEHVFRWRAARSTVLSRNMLERPFVLLLGSRARHKNTGLILGLASALDEIGVDIVVTGGNAAAFAGLAKQAVARNVIDVGFVGDDDLAALLSRALCLTFPSITEGFGLPLVEAMALGCPIVSSDRASMPEVCGGAALMAAPDDPEAWLNHIRRLLRSRDMRAEYSTRGFERVTAYSWRNSAEGYLDLVGKGFH